MYEIHYREYREDHKCTKVNYKQPENDIEGR